MRRADLEKLLGGYSAGILTPDEEQALYAAALEDQDLFDALAGEQPLRDLLQDPVVRARLLAAVSDQPLPWHGRILGWVMQPRVLACCAVLFCLVVTLTIWQLRHRRQTPVLTAQVSESAPLSELPGVVSQVPVPPAAPAAQPSKPLLQPLARDADGPKTKALLDSGAVTNAPANAPIAASEPFAKKQELAEAKPGNTGVIGGVPESRSQLPPVGAPPAANTVDSTGAVQAAPSAPPPDLPLPVRQYALGRAVNPAPPAPVVPAARKMEALQAESLKVRPQVSPLHWAVFRRRPGEEFVGGEPGNLQAGDEVKLRVQSNAAGYVYVVEKQLPLASSHLESGQSFETVIPPRDQGQRTLNLWFSDRPIDWARPVDLRSGLFTAGSGGQQAKDVSTNVAAPAGAGGNFLRPVPVTITLNYQ